jgi:peptide/nickel transport system permease protein
LSDAIIINQTQAQSGPANGRLNLVLRKMWHLRLGVLGAFVIICLIITALFTPYLAPADPYKQNILNRLKPPAWVEGGNPKHLLGTDQLGRDILSRIMYGTRISLLVGISAVLLEVVIGVILGLVAGYYGGKVDSVISFFVNTMMAFPFILLSMSLVAVLGPSLENIIIALGLTGWPVFTRIARIETIKLKDREFILASRTQAFKVNRILRRHILPNLLPSILVLATVEVARAIIRESLLSFLGLGIQPPTPSWGTMLASGRDFMLMQWWLAAFPGLAIFLAALGINLMGDALRDLTDPHLRKS